MKNKSYLFILIFFIFLIPWNNSFSQAPNPQQIAKFNNPDSLNVRLIGRWADGPCLAVDVAGNIAYFGNGAYLEIVDFSNPAQPVELSKIILTATVSGIKISATYAYIANARAGLRIIDVSNPSNPVEVAYCNSPGQASGLEISGTNVYLADGDRGLRIIDISNPFQPKEIGSYDTNGQASRVAVSGNFAYIAEYGGMRVIDISNPYQPDEVEFYSTNSNVMDVAISGNYAYIAAGSAGFRLLDISNPYNLSEIGALSNYGYANGIAVGVTYAYLVDGQAGLRIIDVSDPSHPSEVGYYDTDGTPQDVTLSGNYTFVADGHNGLRVINVSNPFQPNEVGFFNTDGISRGVAVDSNSVYLVKYEAGLRIINTSDPSKPIKIAILNLNGRAEDVVVNGNYAYFTNYENGLRIIDITDPTQPVEAGSITQNVYPKRVVKRGDYAYIADNTAGLRIVDISNPSQLILIGSIDFPGTRADAIALKGDHAYLAAGNDGLKIVDISVPSQPIEVGAYNPGGTTISIEVNGNHAYMGTLQHDFRIVDITTPAQPIEVESLMMDSPLYEIMVKGRYVYFANGDSGLRVIDIINPSNPVQAGYYITGSTAFGITIDENYVYLSDGNTGLYILEFLPASLNKAPFAPLLISPVNNSFVNQTTPLLTWQIPADENGDLLHFRVELDKDGNWSNIDYVVESKNSTIGFSLIPPVTPGSGSLSYTIQTPLLENNWLWRVSAWDGLIYSEYSDEWSFAVDATSPVLHSLTYDNPGYDENWFNRAQDTLVTSVLFYDELYPQESSLSGGFLLDTFSMTGLTGGYNQVVRFKFSIANQSDGAYPLKASIQDSAGNIGTVDGLIQLDSTPPYGYYSDAPDTIVAGKSYFVHVLGASDSPGCGIAQICLDVFTNVIGIPTSVQDSLIGVTEPGIYYYRYFAEDHLGNRGEIRTDTIVVIPVISQSPIFPAPQSTEITAGEEFWIDIQVGTEQEPVENLFSVAFELNYSNTQYVASDSVLPGNLLGEDVDLNSKPDNENGEISISITRNSVTGKVDGYGTLVRIKYRSEPNTPHRTPVHFTIPSVTANDSAGNSIELIPQDTTIWIINPFSDFTIDIVPDSQAINPGENAVFTISFDTLGEFDSQISLEISNLPSGMEVAYPSEPFAIPTSFNVIFSTTMDIEPGVYEPIITAIGGGIIHKETVGINVLPRPDFIMIINPDSQAVHAGENVEFQISFVPVGGFNAKIVVEVSNVPSGMDAIFASPPFGIPAAFSITFTTLRNIPPAVYYPIVTANGGGITHQEMVAINVLPKPSIQEYSVQPNPFTPNNDGFNDYVEFQYPETSSGSIMMLIFNIDGRKIKEIRNSKYWYGKDDKGRDVKPGAYIYIVKDGEKVISKGVISLAR